MHLEQRLVLPTTSLTQPALSAGGIVDWILDWLGLGDEGSSGGDDELGGYGDPSG